MPESLTPSPEETGEKDSQHIDRRSQRDKEIDEWLAAQGGDEEDGHVRESWEREQEEKKRPFGERLAERMYTAIEQSISEKPSIEVGIDIYDFFEGAKEGEEHRSATRFIIKKTNIDESSISEIRPATTVWAMAQQEKPVSIGDKCKALSKVLVARAEARRGAVKTFPQLKKVLLIGAKTDQLMSGILNGEDRKGKLAKKFQGQLRIMQEVLRHNS